MTVLPYGSGGLAGALNGLFGAGGGILLVPLLLRVHKLPAQKAFATSLNAETAASRLMVDHDFMPYAAQVGLTGKTVNPDVYIALGVSGAVHHIAGIRQSGTVIAVNSDPKAPIFDYADYGIVCDVQEIL